MYSAEKVVPLRPEDRAFDRLPALLERRSEIESELKVVSAPESTRTAAAAALASAEAALAELDRSERAAWIAWSENPDSEQPAPCHEERRRLEQRRALGVANLRAADAAVSAIQGRLASLGAEMRQLGPQIYGCRLANLMGEADEIEKQYRAAHASAAEQISRLRALHNALCTEKAAANTRGDEQVAIALQTAIARLDGLKPPDDQRNYGEVLAMAADWRKAFQ
jgi:hypothetical protein